MLDVEQSPELQAAVLALSLMNRDLKREIAQEARPGLTALWSQGIAERASTPAERAVLVPSARVSVGDRRIRASAATSRRKLSGGLVPSEQWPGFEYGAAVKEATVHGTSPRGKSYTYRRRVNTQFGARVKKGRIAMRAAGDLGPAIVSGWVQLIVGKLAGAFDVER